MELTCPVCYERILPDEKYCSLICDLRAQLAAAVAAKEQAERERDDRRQSLAQEIVEGLDKRGYWTNKRRYSPSDVIMFVFKAITELEAYRDRLAGEVAVLRAALVKADILLYELNLLETKKKTLPDHLASRVADILGETRAALSQPAQGAQESAPDPHEGAVKRSEYWKAENIAANAEIERLKEALQLLYDNQNGCPLPKYEADWNRAMQLAEAVLYPPAVDKKGGAG